MAHITPAALVLPSARCVITSIRKDPIMRNIYATVLLSVLMLTGRLCALPADPISDVWRYIEDNLMLALEARMKQRLNGMQRLLDDREKKEIEDITALLNELVVAIQTELKEPGPIQLELWQNEEKEQLQRDMDALKFRLSQIPEELEKEVENIKAHYADPHPRMYPVAVVFLVPESMGGK